MKSFLIRRRDFFAASLLLIPSLAHSQKRLPRVVFFRGALYSEWTDGFVSRLAELKYRSGLSIDLVIPEAQSSPEELRVTMERLISEGADVVVTTGTTATVVAQRATKSVPIVFLAVSDPVKAGIVTNLARPEMNVTGISNVQSGLIGKRVEYLRGMLSTLQSLGVLFNVNNPAGISETQELTRICESLSIRITPLPISSSADIQPVLASSRNKIEALYVFGDYLSITHRKPILDFASAAKLPAIYPFMEFVIDGGLASYGPNVISQFHRAAEYVARILQGTKPSDLPVEQPSRFELVLNGRAADMLGIKFTPAMLLTAERVID